MSNGISPYMLAGTQKPIIEGLLDTSTQDSTLKINEQKLAIKEKLEEQIKLAEERAKKKEKNRFLGIGGDLGKIFSKIDKNISLSKIIGGINPIAGAIMGGLDKYSDLSNIQSSRKELLNVDDRFSKYSWLKPQYEDYMEKAESLQVDSDDIAKGALITGATDFISGAKSGEFIEGLTKPFKADIFDKEGVKVDKFLPKNFARLKMGLKGGVKAMDNFELEGNFLQQLQKILGYI
jgi:hypothetical protein